MLKIAEMLRVVGYAPAVLRKDNPIIYVVIPINNITSLDYTTVVLCMKKYIY